MTDDMQSGLGDIPKHPIAEGDMARIVELAGVCTIEEIPCEIVRHGPGDGYARNGFGPSELFDLLVPLDMMERALGVLEEHDKINPETNKGT